MKNKKTFFIVLILGVAATLVMFFLQGRLLPFGMNRVLYDNGYYGETLLPEPGMMGSGVTGGGFIGQVAEDMPAMEKTSMGMALPVDDVSYLPPYNYGDDALDVDDRVYQKSSYHSVVVEDVAGYIRGVKEYILSIDGRVLNTSVSAGDKYDSGYLYVKVPVAKFDEATSRVTENVEKVVNEDVSSSDVTGQLVNTTDNLQSLKDAKSLKEAAMEDAETEVEKRRYQIEIERLERQIEAAEKNLDRVETQVEYSSMSINAASSERYFNPSADLSVKEEFLRAWESLKEVLKVVGYFGIWVLVYSIAWLPLVLILRKLLSYFKK